MVFITREDVLGHDKPIYHIKRKIEETDRDFHDEAYIIYVNSSKQEDTDLGKLMHDFHCRTAEEMYSKVLAERVFELKETHHISVLCLFFSVFARQAHFCSCRTVLFVWPTSNDPGRQAHFTAPAPYQAAASPPAPQRSRSGRSAHRRFRPPRCARPLAR